MKCFKNFSLFEVKRKEPNGKRFLMMLALFIVILTAPYATVVSQQKQFERFEIEYMALREWFVEYETTYDTMPLLEKVDWKNEKRLKVFLNRFGIEESEAYYIDVENFDLSKRTYIILLENKTLYTSKPVYYSMERWHTLLDRPVFSIVSLE